MWCNVPVNDHVDRRLWHSGLGLTTLALATGLALVVALALGWNSPRPIVPPDWQAAGLPLYLGSSSTNSCSDTVSLLDYSGDDFTLELEAAVLSPSDSGFYGYGLVYRAQDSAHYYAFGVGSDGYYGVLQVAGGEETSLVDWQQFPHVRRGRQVNRLRVTCAGATCRFYINDEYATTVEDDTWLAGDVGLWTRGGKTAQFLYARVWEE